MNRVIGGLALTLGLSGCASVPDVTYRYFGSTWSATVQVVMTVGCASVPDPSAPGGLRERPIVLYAPTVTTAYMRDPALELSLAIRKLSRFTADVDVAMTLTEDGRLDGINQSTTGSGEAIVKSIVALSSSLGSLPKSTGPSIAWSSKIARPGLAGGSASQPESAACQTIKSWAGQNKPVTLIFRKTVDNSSLGDTASIPLEPTPDSANLAAALKDAMPRLSIRVGAGKLLPAGPVMNAPPPGEAVMLKLQETATVDLSIHSDVESEAIGRSAITYPTAKLHELPIPRAALFGKQTFALKLSPAGMVTAISYGRTSGAVGAVNAMNELVKTQTASTEAAALKAQIDLIKSQKELWDLLAPSQP